MKKKIKGIFGFIFALLILAFSVFVYAPRKVSADTDIDYGEYNYLINFCTTVYECGQEYYYFNVIARISNNQLLYIDNDNVGGALISSSIDLDGFGLYLINATSLEPSFAWTYFEFVINLAISYDFFLAQYDSYSYAIGYNQGYANGLENSYDVGFQAGVDSIVPGNARYEEIYYDGVSAENVHYQEGQLGYQLIYDQGYAAALDDIGEDDPTFLVMFKSVINYFVEFFTVGLNVEIFGVNIGGFCIAIFMLSIMMFIVRFIFGR